MTQGQMVLHHLKHNKSINSSDALTLYGISRLAAVIYQLVGAGVKIHSERRKGVKKYATYSEYSLIHEVS